MSFCLIMLGNPGCKMLIKNGRKPKIINSNTPVSPHNLPNSLISQIIQAIEIGNISKAWSILQQEGSAFCPLDQSLLDSTIEKMFRTTYQEDFSHIPQNFCTSDPFSPNITPLFTYPQFIKTAKSLPNGRGTGFSGYSYEFIKISCHE